MNKLLLSILSVLVLLLSCKKGKEDEGPATDGPHEVSFNIILSDQNILELPGKSVMSTAESRPGGKLSEYFDKLECYLYNSSGVKVFGQSIDPDESARGFKIPVFNLVPGDYTIVFLGRKEKNTGTSSAIYFGDDQNSPYLSHSLTREVTDLFYASQEFEVKNETSQIDIPFKRPGGKCKILIEDEWPANVDRIGMSVDGYTRFYPTSDKLAEMRSISLPILKNYVTTFEMVNGVSTPKQTFVDCSYENFVFTNSSNATLLDATIFGYDKLNKQVAKKVLNNIRVERNKITTMKVRLFE